MPLPCQSPSEQSSSTTPSDFRILETVGPAETSATTRKPRASKPKTRTGCKTCKVRRVKCDETKPSCRRCIKFKAKCEGFGYGPVVPKKVTKNLLPKPSRPASTVSKLEQTPPISAILDAVKPLLFINEEEHSSFQYFQIRTADRLSGYFDESSMWGRLVLQACQTDASIRYAVIAMGGLDMALDTAQITAQVEKLDPMTVLGQAESQRQFALKAYGKAIKQMRLSLSEPKQDMRSILIACLLFVAFEAFHGNNTSAVQQAHAGVRMLNEWLPQLVSPNQDDRQTLKGLRSPAPKIIEDELVQAFSRLDVVTFDTKSVQIHPSLKSDIADIHRLLPTEFSTLDEARMYFDLIWRQALHYIMWVHGWGAAIGFNTDGDSPPDYLNFRQLPKPVLIEMLNANPAMKHEAELQYSIFPKFISAFEPLFRRSRTPAGRKDFVAATTLRMHVIAGYISISGGFADIMELDKRLDEFTEVIDLAEVLTDTLRLRESRARATFMLGGPLSGCLYISATACRNPVIRRRAIDILERQPRREGLWDSALTAKLCRTIMKLEEAGMVDGVVPASSRVHSPRTVFNLQARMATLTYEWYEPPPGGNHGDIMQMEITW